MPPEEVIEELPLPQKKIHDLEELEIDKHVFYTRKH